MGRRSQNRKGPRAAERVSVRFVADYAGKRLEGTGAVRNLSQTGALIEPAEPPIPTGAEVKLRIATFGAPTVVELRADVVRATPYGFALRFRDLDAEAREALRVEIAKALTGRSPDEEDDSTLPHL